MEKTEHLTDRVKNAPGRPGVYLMKDKDDKVIYVGKAKDLRARVRSYFGGTDSRPMVSFLVLRVCDLEYIVTATEKEALILENNLIKKYRPRYNVNFRDDRAYFNIRLNMKDRFPRFELVRRVKRDGARYFGPYASSASVKETLGFLQRIFPLRTCSDVEFCSRRRPCIEYEIKRCLAPCCGLVDKDAYHKQVKDAAAFLEGNSGGLISDLRLRMSAAVKELRFEEAAAIRDMIAAIEETLEKQRVVSMSFKDQDIFGLYREGDLTQICAIFIRKGRFLGRKSFPLFKIGADSGEILSSLIKQYYDGEVFIPEEIVIPDDICDRDVIENWLAEKKGRKVSIVFPKKGQKKGLLNMAGDNAENIFRMERASGHDVKGALKTLKDLLHLKRLPNRIECFDISNTGGSHAVGSMVTFVEGISCKSDYRRFKIKTVHGMDDYAMMREVLRRRYGKGGDIPDLIVVDGGKGQLGVALAVLKELEIEEVDTIGLAKETSNHVPGSSFPKIRKGEDRVYIPKRKDPIYLSKHPEALFLLQRVRDEAHRFAVTYHRRLKEREDRHSLLDSIPGIGEIRKKALFTHFGDMNRMREAPVEELRKVPGIGKEAARRIHAFLCNSTIRG